MSTTMFITRKSCRAIKITSLSSLVRAARDNLMLKKNSGQILSASALLRKRGSTIYNYFCNGVQTYYENSSIVARKGMTVHWMVANQSSCGMMSEEFGEIISISEKHRTLKVLITHCIGVSETGEKRTLQCNQVYFEG